MRISTKAKSGDRQKSRLPITSRVEKSKRPGFRLTQRDLDIIWTVFRYRVLTTPQIEALVFDTEDGQSGYSKSTRCRHRLKLLFHHGYLQRHEQPSRLSEGRRPLVYSLDKQAVMMLEDANELGNAITKKDLRSRPFSFHFLEHILATNEFRIAIELSTRGNEIVLDHWIDEQTLKNGFLKHGQNSHNANSQRAQISVIPDGYFQLSDVEFRYHHFLEIDRATETINSKRPSSRTFARKIMGYLAYFKSGEYGKQFNTNSGRVLTVTTSLARLSNMKSVAEKHGGSGYFWFTTYDQLSAVTVLTNAIWSVAGYDGVHTFFQPKILTSP